MSYRITPAFLETYEDLIASDPRRYLLVGTDGETEEIDIMEARERFNEQDVFSLNVGNYISRFGPFTLVRLDDLPCVMTKDGFFERTHKDKE